MAERRAAGETFGPERPWTWHTDADGRSVACVGLDATGMRQQGPRGEKCDGRMPWVATAFNPALAGRGDVGDDRRDRVTKWCHELKHAGGEALLATLESLDLATTTAATIEEHRLLTDYPGSNLHRTESRDTSPGAGRSARGRWSRRARGWPNASRAAARGGAHPARPPSANSGENIDTVQGARGVDVARAR